VPTSRCLREWIECSYFDITSEARRPALARPGRWQRLIQNLNDRVASVRMAAVQPTAGSVSRCVIAARAVRRADKVYELPDADLARFNVSSIT
jgi:hypothetical protein